MRHFILASAKAIALAGMCAGASGSAHSQQVAHDDPRIGGVAIDQTITVNGQLYYRYFSSFWRDKEAADRFVISVHEKPSARWGSSIFVEYRQQRIHQARLPNASGRIEAVAREAAEQCYQNLLDTEASRLLFREADLGPDEL